MQIPLNASATTAGSLFSSTMFEVPPYQREYAWGQDEVADFWGDLQRATQQDSYFLGLLILTREGQRMHVVDGQQRVLSVTLLTAALYHEAMHAGRKALAERLQSDFLTAIDYETDKARSRVILTDAVDDETLREIVASGKVPDNEDGRYSNRILEAFSFLQMSLKEDLKSDPFKRLGIWSEFITNKLYFAVFVHPDAASAYRVFEVINTRGKDLTTAELLKNYVLSNAETNEKAERYSEWQRFSRSFPVSGSNSFVQYIRHVVTVEAGHILPTDLFDFIAARQSFGPNKTPPSIPTLMGLLDKNLPLYLQMVDPSVEGPAGSSILKAFAALNDLGVISVRPLMLAMSQLDDAEEGIISLLRLVVRRIVAGNLGTGTVERMLGEAAHQVHKKGEWRTAWRSLQELDPGDELFLEKIKTRSFNKSVLSFVRRSLVQGTQTPEKEGMLHFVAPRQQSVWDALGEEDLRFWGGTLANTFLARIERRPKGVNNWAEFKEAFFPCKEEGEIVDFLEQFDEWSVGSLDATSLELVGLAKSVWC